MTAVQRASDPPVYNEKNGMVQHGAGPAPAPALGVQLGAPVPVQEKEKAKATLTANGDARASAPDGHELEHPHDEKAGAHEHAGGPQTPASAPLAPSPISPISPVVRAYPQPQPNGDSSERAEHTEHAESHSDAASPPAAAGAAAPAASSASAVSPAPPAALSRTTEAAPAPGPSRHILATHVAAHPEDSVKRAIHAQFPKPNPLLRLARRFQVKHSVIKGMTHKEWEHWDARGPELRRKAGWKMQDGEEGTEVSELFWKMYLSLMPTLERDPLSGLTTPDLLGSTSTVPLTIISLIPDIMRHYRDVIVRAEKEVFLATNYWQPSNSVNTITGSLRELSDLVVRGGRAKVVVKIMYDRGSVEQLWNSHAMVAPEGWAAIDLPKTEDIPGLELEVINFHRVLLGTFHAKFLIVDRKVALINSNNIQDRPNLELMSHLEGPIVDSFYEVALHSWYNRLDPPLPCISTPYTPPPGAPGNQYLFSDANPYLHDIEIVRAAKEARSRLRQETLATDAEMARAQEHGVDRLREAVRRVVDQQRQSLADWRPGERLDESMQNAMHELREIRDRWAAGMSGAGTRSRPGSRGPSRRSSAHEGMLRTLMRGGDKPGPGEYTISHAPLHPGPSQNGNGNAEAESEAPSSPTMTDIPVKSHTAPPMPGAASSQAQPQYGTGIAREGLGLGNDLPPPAQNQNQNQSQNATDRAHVAFAPLDTDTQFDGSGRFMDESEALTPTRAKGEAAAAAAAANKDNNSDALDAHHKEKPGLVIPKPQFSQRLTASPMSGSVKLPESPTSILARRSAPGSPSIRATDPPSTATATALADGPGGPGAAGAAGGDGHVAFAGLPPAKEDKSVAEKVADRTVREELVHASEEQARESEHEQATAGEREREGGDAVPALPRPSMSAVRDREDGGRSETATLDGVPLGNTALGVVESEVPEGKGTKRLYKMSKMFNAAGVLSEAWATVEDSDELDNFGPHVIHTPHEPVPVAMCCRKPHGFPGHHDIRNPQNAAWLAGFRYAQKKVFVPLRHPLAKTLLTPRQSPTLNARPIVRAIKQACRRGVEVVLLLDLGFNDKGESIPFQGGTNEEVVDRLYKALNKEGKAKHLKVYWYTGKDQVRPLNAVVKQRNCHIKFAAYDDQVVIIGNGNQDSQSWFHSQEVNVMIDSKQICKEMMDQLLLNQNTIEYGLVDTDGVWRDKEGKTLKDYGATAAGKFRGLSGFIAFAKTI